jgi:hypothetical protein
MKPPNDPKSQTEEVLFYLITRMNITRRQMMLSCSVLNLPDQVMRLRKRYGLIVTSKKVSTTNKFEREVEYTEYSISDKKTALKIYKEMQLQNH